MKKEAENLKDSENAELIQKNFKLENVIEELRPSAVQNIENNQEAQTKTQDKLYNIEEVPYTIGTIVLRKNVGMLHKFSFLRTVHFRQRHTKQEL